MRPRTLAEVSERILAGEPLDKALAEFLDEFYDAISVDEAEAMLAAAPPPTGVAYADALLGAVGDYLSMQYLRRRLPAWTSEPIRFLKQPAFTSALDSASVKAWLMHNSPAEFKHHNIFTEAVPLRRKRSEHPRWTAGATKAQAGR
jgi:hypothetical protein